jgi:hypothetical protein
MKSFSLTAARERPVRAKHTLTKEFIVDQIREAMLNCGQPLQANMQVAGFRPEREPLGFNGQTLASFDAIIGRNCARSCDSLIALLHGRRRASKRRIDSRGAIAEPEAAGLADRPAQATIILWVVLDGFAKWLPRLVLK